MVKSEALSSDIEFIKEFGELKIKQKLLTDALKKKIISNENKLFIDINSKLDFLIKIFKESSDSEDTDEVPIEEKIKEVFVKSMKNLTDEISNINSKLDKLTEKIESLSNNRSTSENRMTEDLLVTHTLNDTKTSTLNASVLDNSVSSHNNESNNQINDLHTLSNNLNNSLNKDELPLLDIKKEVSKKNLKLEKKRGVFKWL